MINNEVPDYFAERIVDIKAVDYKVLFCFDVKSKRNIDYFGWVNERAIHGYKKFYASCKIPVYLIFILMKNSMPTEKIGYCNILDEPMHSKISLDKNRVLIYSWQNGIPFL